MFFPQIQIDKYEMNVELKAIILAMIVILVLITTAVFSVQIKKSSERRHYHAMSMRGLVSAIASKKMTIE